MKFDYIVYIIDYEHHSIALAGEFRKYENLFVSNMQGVHKIAKLHRDVNRKKSTTLSLIENQK